MENKILNLAGRREVFWDDHFINTELTTAAHRLHSPTETDFVMVCDEPWEGNECVYHSLVSDGDGLLRMYYAASGVTTDDNGTETMHPRKYCYAESRDGGFSWVKPIVGSHEFNGSYENNIVIDESDIEPLDCFLVFRDTNPACPPEEKYKGIASCFGQRIGEKGIIELWCYPSADGIHFKKGWMIVRGTDLNYWNAVEGLTFDTLNNAFWDEANGIYHCYVRGMHGRAPDGEKSMIRDIRHLTSRDFKSWSEPEELSYMGKDVYPLYTNCISIYSRAPQIFVGFPTRYMGRGGWSANYSRLCGAEERKRKMESFESRAGLVVTDCVFMCSRDGQNWCRYDEAFMRPGPERPDNWNYGSCYLALGLLETPGRYGTESRLSILAPYNYQIGDATRIMRYEIRKDGFVSLNAPYSGAKTVTKPFTFEGKGLAINFSTSARGYVYITLKSATGLVANSGELFGDSCDRTVDFDRDLSDFAGKETVMEIEMRDADIYSVKFD